MYLLAINTQSRNHSLIIIFASAVLAMVASVFISTDVVDSKTALTITVLSIATILGIVCYKSKKTWIPILICMMLVRDFHLGNLFGGGTLKVGDIFIGYLFLLWLGKDLILNKSTHLLKIKLDAFILLFMFVHVLSLLWSTDIEFGMLRVLKLIRNMMFYIIMRELFIEDFLGSLNKSTVYYTVTGIVLLAVHIGIVLMFGGYYDFLTFYQKESLTSQDLGALRVMKTGGGFLITGPALWLFIAAILNYVSLMRTTERGTIFFKYFLILLFVLGAMLTLQRSLVVMVLIMFVVKFIGSLLLNYKKDIIGISTILVAFMVIGSSLGLTNIFEKRFENAFEDSSWVIRTEFYAAAFEAFRDSPIIGIGAGSNYSWLKAHAEIGDDTRIVHSAYMLVLSETGAIGMFMFIGMVYWWIKYLLDAIRNPNNIPFMRIFSMTLFAFSASYLVYIVQVGEFEELEVWFVMAIASAIRILNNNMIATGNQYCEFRKMYA